MRLVTFLCLSVSTASANTECCIPFLKKIPFFVKKEYTPLLFFRVPPGLSPQCDAMEASVREIEAELDVHFERMDIARSKEALLLMQLLGPDLPPVLYHRESRQTYQLRPPSGAAAVDDEAQGAKAPTVKVDMNRVRALAKGRRLTIQRDVITGQPVFIGAEGVMDEDDVLDQQLPPLQRKGRQAMKARSDAKERR